MYIFPEYDYTKEHVQYNQFIKGTITCGYEPRVYGVGYLAEGKYKPSENGKKTKYYDVWNKMLYRCYSPKYIQKHPTYEHCEVCKEWLNFQVFSDWFQTNYYEIEGQIMNLDKDILCKGNKIYSPQTCIFVPQTINILFIKRDNDRGKFPVGVTYHRNKKYEAQCNMNGKRKYLGNYKSPEEAFYVYKNFKENYIKEVANQYKNVIPQKLYDAMIKYEIEIDD